MSTNTKVKKLGFTLIELLVVIAIIALLLSIIVPGLKKAKDHARKTMCMSGIRQLTVAFGLYQEDNDQKYPSAIIAGLSDDQNAITTYSKWGGNRGMEQGMVRTNDIESVCWCKRSRSIWNYKVRGSIRCIFLSQ